MQQLIASYLFQNKTCPLPGLGTLSIHTSGAEADFISKQVSAPKPVIQFEEKDTEISGFLNYIAATTHGNNYEVSEALDHFCDNLKNDILNRANAKLDGIGNFFVAAKGRISFKEEALPAVYLPPLFAERVIHPKAEHHILVGDRETTNSVMTKLLNEKPVAKNRWWVWAIVLGVIGLLLLLVYFTEANGASPFGNTIKI